MFANILGSLIRHALTAGGGAIFSAGVATGNPPLDAIGAAFAIIGIGLSLYSKYKDGKLTLADVESAAVNAIKDVQIIRTKLQDKPND